MKKLLTVLVIGALFISNSFAQLKTKNLSIGVRGSLGISDLTIDSKVKEDMADDLNEAMILSGFSYSSSSVNNDPILGGGFALWGNYSFDNVPALGLQAELGFLFNNGTEIIGEAKSGTAKIEIKDKVTYTTMELPLLVTYTVNKGGFFEFIPQAGFYLSFPIGKLKQKADITAKVAGTTVGKESDTAEDKIDNVCIFGTAFGADFAFNFDKTSAILLNARYMLDLGELKSDGDKVGTRRVFLFSAGYRYSFN